MKSMKKMLCLLLVAMLLVAAIPVAASADSNTALIIGYWVNDNAVTNGWAENGYVEATTILYDKTQITALRASETVAIDNADIIAKLGINTSKAYIKNVTRYEADDTHVNFNVELAAVDTPTTTNKYISASIYDGETPTGKSINVYCQVVEHSAPAHTEVAKILTAPTASDVKSALGTAYADKTITSITTRIIVGGGSTVPAVYVTTGTAPSNPTGGSTVVTTPVGDGTIVVTPPNGGSNTGNNGSTGNGIIIGGSGSNGSGSTGSGSTGSGSAGNYDFTTPKNLMICYGDRVFTRKVSSQSEFETAKADAIAEMQRYGYTFKGWK